MIQIHHPGTGSLGKDRRGGVEGLPMELLIILVVASVGIALIVGWMGDLGEKAPVAYGDVSSDVTMITITDTGYIINGGSEEVKSFGLGIHVTDSRGDGVKNAVVKLSGLGIKGDLIQGMTDSDGWIHFTGLTLGSKPSGSIGYVIASVSSDLGEHTVKVPVVVA